MDTLTSVILERIRTSGPMTVAEYVETALYHEELGYYARAGQRSGRAGDFITSVDVGPLFGELLAAAFDDMRTVLGGSGPAAGDAGRFDLVEAAAGNGRLARDILDAASARYPGLYAATRLYLAERSPRARAAQAGTLGPHLPLLAGSSTGLPDTVNGVIYANELLDALPPHLVVMREGGLREVYVTEDGGRLATREDGISSQRIPEYLDRVGARLEPGWFAEVNLAAADWLRDAGRRLARGFLVVIDYGHEASTLYSASHAAGTLTTYRRHAAERRDDGPGWLSEPGDRDITSHVDLTGVALAGEEAGLRLLAVTDQTYFLLGLADRTLRAGPRLRSGQGRPAPPVGGAGFLAGRIVDDGPPSPEETRRRLALKTLLLPGGMGGTLKVMVFAKAVDAERLQGLSFGGRLT